IVDFSKYQDGTPTRTGDVIYLTNTMEMLNGRKPDNQFGFAVPMLKFVVGSLPRVPDQSLMPVPGVTPLRASPPFPATGLGSGTRTFTLQRGGGVPVPGQTGTETQWLINGLEFDPVAPLAVMKVNTFETWNVNNGGGGWVHPMHLHQEEHHVLGRTGTDPGLPGAPPAPDFVDPRNDTGKEDVITLAGSEQSTIYRGFRTYCGNYVAHCHNLAHEDHNMMFGWVIAP
ncbi:MAG TPA: multicopper oxidase domain-containing protein, partial [Anaeromyxobacteraceae bacterium]|nr:multicopper oxidase domain-containing protein [Anaeromyxobacteraceae bacterium]